MKIKNFIIISIIYVGILVVLNYSIYTIPLESESRGIGEWEGTGQEMESTVLGPSFIVDYIGEELWKIIWITILIVPGIIIVYKFIKQIKLNKTL